MQKNFDVVVIGGGAAGLFCAAMTGQSGKSVVLLEHNQQTGRKILISGGGRCNFTNRHSGPEDFSSQNKHFVKSALSQFGPADFIAMVESYKIDYYEKKLGQLFCKQSAKLIVELLEQECKKGSVEVQTEAHDLKVEWVDKKFRIYNSELDYFSDALVVATGGLSIKQLGASDFGYLLAKQFKHKIIPPRPALVGLHTDEFENLAGVSLTVEVKVADKQIRDDLLFTHKGLSGPVILKASLYAIHDVEICINFLPDQNIIEQLKHHSKQSIYSLLKNFLPKRLCTVLLNKINLDEGKNCADLNKAEIQRLLNGVHHFCFKAIGNDGFRKAEVTAGGVDTLQISSKTMQSKLQPGLYFIGEVLDVTGQLGGHNFQWAWSSGYACSRDLASKF